MATNNPVALAALMSFIKQPQAQAQQVDFTKFMQPRQQSAGSQLRAKERLRQQEAQSMASLADQIYGQQGSPMETVSDQLSEQAYQDVTEQGPVQGLMDVAKEAVPATGMYDESVPLQRRMVDMNKRMLASGNAGFGDQWAKNQSAMQGSNMTNIGAMNREEFKRDNPTAGAFEGAAKFAYPDDPAAQREAVIRWKSKRMFADPGNVPYSITDQSKLMMPDGSNVPVDLTPAMAAAKKVVPRDTMNAGDASKIAGYESAIEGFKVIDANMFMADPDTGEKVLNEEAINDMWVKNLHSETPDFIKTATLPMLNKYMSPQGQAIAAAYDQGIQSITRGETGAAMPASELGNTRSRFLPEPGEDPSVSKWKYDAYQRFIRNAKKYIDPIRKKNGRVTSADVDRAAQQALNEVPRPGAIPAPPIGTKRGDWTYNGGDPKNKSSWSK